MKDVYKREQALEVRTHTWSAGRALECLQLQLSLSLHLLVVWFAV